MLQCETEELERDFLEKFRVSNDAKKKYLKRQIAKIRKL